MRTFIPILLLFCLQGFAQDINPNLVPNPSFEETVHYPVIPGNFGSAVKYWFNYGSSDYFHTEGINGTGVPDNWYGNNYPHSIGDAYAGIVTYAKPYTNFREYIAVKLDKKLVEGSLYKIQFFTSLSDSVNYATKNLGVYLSEDSIIRDDYVANIFLSVSPNFEYDDGFLQNKKGWDLVEGRFKANGGEEYLIIGNFSDDASTDTLYVGGGSENFLEHDFSYYYIDDVSLTLESATGIVDQSNERNISVYPNPNNGSMFIEYSGLEENSKLELYNMAGQIVDSYEMRFSGNGILSIDRTDLPSGVYTYVIIENGIGIITDRVIVK